MASNTVAQNLPDADAKHSRADLHEALRDLKSIDDRDSASRRLVEKLVSLSSGDVEIDEIGQLPLHLLNANGSPHKFRIHPQGMEIDSDTGLIYITAVEIIEEREDTRQHCGKGKAHLFECDLEGTTIRSINLVSDHEEEYHPSGMVLIHGTLYIALAQYLPETSATIIKFNVKDWRYEKLFRIHDHVGLVIPNLDEGELLLGTWGSRHYYCTNLKGDIISKHQNPCSDGMEHQDAQLVRGGVANVNINPSRTDPEIEWDEGTTMLATGVTASGMEHFGLDLIDITRWRIIASLRWPSAQHLTKDGWAPFANPTFLWIDSRDRVLALAAPDGQHEQTSKIAALRLYMLSRCE